MSHLEFKWFLKLVMVSRRAIIKELWCLLGEHTNNAPIHLRYEIWREINFFPRQALRVKDLKHEKPGQRTC